MDKAAFVQSQQVQDVAPPFSEEALALEFAEKYADKLRYVDDWRRWFIWDGTCWRRDETLKVFSLARDLCRANAATANKQAKLIASAKTVAAVVSLARADRRLAATTKQWDRDLWLLNTPGGVVDLHTGKLRPHKPEDYMTKITAFTPGGDCPQWKKFIKKVTKDDEQYAKYLQRSSGYALTGLISEHVLFFLYGSGQNGKSQFLLTLAGVMGDYHRAAPIEVFLESNTDRHPTELAWLAGVRLVTATEPPAGRRWNFTRIAQLTGEDDVPARFMRQDFFQYKPQFKLFVAGNHKPKLRSVNKAASRRINILPFLVTIPDEEKVLNLAQKLIAKEGAGILAWMIKGCLDLQENGLAPPDAVTKATEEYLVEENVLKTWFNECCQERPQAEIKSSILYANWRKWAEANNEFVGSHKDFTRQMKDLGYTTTQRNDGAYWKGITDSM